MIKNYLVFQENTEQWEEKILKPMLVIHALLEKHAKNFQL
jgi:hypothetical protein